MNSDLLQSFDVALHYNMALKHFIKLHIVVCLLGNVKVISGFRIW
jgi:hypothetical protein